jgi:uncharacterized protein (TIGR03083 family)
MTKRKHMADVMTMAMHERADFAELLASLSPRPTAAATLCEGWSVRDVVAHAVSYDELGWLGTIRRFVRAGFNPEKANAIGVAEYSRSPAELLRILRVHQRPRGLPAVRGG